jgi:hypothetical protein
MPDCHLRLRTIRFKDGRAPLTILREVGSFDQRLVAKRIGEVIARHGPDVAGFAIVCWQKDCASTADYGCSPVSPIPESLVCDFVRNRLLIERIDSWRGPDHTLPPDAS